MNNCELDKVLGIECYSCNYCAKIYKHRQTKWKHEKVCQQKKMTMDKMADLEKCINEMKTELETVKSKPSTVINNVNKGTINKSNIYNFLTKPGEENINVLSEKEIEYIMDQEMNCLIALVEMINFNEKYPENHSFCNTSLSDKYISTINTETLTIEKQRKIDFFDRTLNNGIRNMKLLYDKLSPMVKKTAKARNYKHTIDNLTEFVVVNNKGKKTYVELMNVLTFNKRHIAQSTWFQLMNNQVPKTSDEIKYDDEDQTFITDKLTLENKHKHNIIHYSDSDLESDDESENEYDKLEEDDELPIIKIKNETYYFDNSKLFEIVNGKKGKYVGVLVGGKIKKEKVANLEI